MITYDKSAFGLNLILRVHGSAAYRAVVPGLLAVACLLVLRYARDGSLTAETRDENDLQHPYAIGILVASTTFLIVFRANQGYSRYWESAGAIHHMMSKWMDATIHTGKRAFYFYCMIYILYSTKYSSLGSPHLNIFFLDRLLSHAMCTL